jgi:hypothetical protein
MEDQRQPIVPENHDQRQQGTHMQRDVERLRIEKLVSAAAPSGEPRHDDQVGRRRDWEELTQSLNDA